MSISSKIKKKNLLVSSFILYSRAVKDTFRFLEELSTQNKTKIHVSFSSLESGLGRKPCLRSKKEKKEIGASFFFFI